MAPAVGDTQTQPGAQVEVTIEADEKDTTAASEQSTHPNSRK